MTATTNHRQAERTTDVQAPVVAPEPTGSRRSLIRNGLAGAAGLVLGVLGRPGATEAAAGSPMLLGKANSAGTAATSLATKAAGIGLTVAQTGAGAGLKASAGAGVGATVSSTANNGLNAVTASNGRIGVYAANNAAATGAGAAMRADGKQNAGLIASTATGAAQAVRVLNTSPGTGISAGVGIRVLTGGAVDSAITGASSVPSAGEFASTGNGVTGIGAVGVDGYGTTGIRGTSPAGTGVRGSTDTGKAVYGTGGASGYGVYGESDTGIGVKGYAYSGPGVVASSYNGDGLQADSSFGLAVSGYSWASHALKGISDYGNGVYGITNAPNATGVYGQATLAGSYGLYSMGKAGVSGNLGVTGNVTITGSISKGSGTFRIDHPLDPARKFLSHSFVESPDMKNVYDGVVTLDRDGTATVSLPGWFEALNRDHRFQLTPMGASMPDLHVRAGIADGSFSIAGGRAGHDVCWQVTGIRKDAYAVAHPTPVEEDKIGEEVGLYLHPEEHGQPAHRGIGHAEAQRIAAEPPGRLAGPRPGVSDPGRPQG